MEATNLGFCSVFGVHADLKLNIPILPRHPILTCFELISEGLSALMQACEACFLSKHISLPLAYFERSAGVSSRPTPPQDIRNYWLDFPYIH